MMSDAGWLRRTVWWLQDTPQHIRDLPENVRRSVTRAKKSTWDKKPSWEEVREKLEKLHWNYESQRIVFFAVNFLLLIVAVTSVCLGIYLYTARDEYAALTPISFNAMSSAGLLVFTGVTAAIISVVGCTAVYLRNQILVITYTGFICLLAILQIMTGAIGYYEQERSELAVRHDLLLNINSSRITTTLTQRVLIFTWDRLQSTLKCCGADYYKDWFNNVQWPRNEFVPDSCCIADKFEGVEDMVGCGKMTNNRELWYQQGCYPVFSNWLFQHIRIVGTMAGLFVLASFFAIFMGILVYFRLKKEEHLYGPKGPTDAQLQAKIQQELQLDGPETVVKQRVDRIVEVRKRLFEYDNPDPGKDRTKTTMHDFIPSDYEDENECPYRKAARRKFRNPALVARESAEAKRHAQEQGLLDGEHPDEPIPEYIPQDPAEPTQARFPPV